MLTTKYQTLKEAEENLSNHYKWLTKACKQACSFKDVMNCIICTSS